MLKKRNSGIDCLRILCMVYIVLVHYVGFGGISPADPDSKFPVVSSAMQMLVICAVNCFGMISGYVGYTEKKKPHAFYGYASLWLEVAFYGLLPYLVCLALGISVGWKDCLKALFPLTTNVYWYFTAYTPLFFLMPFLNDCIRGSSRQQLVKVCLVLAVLFSGISVSNDSFWLHNGYSFAWLLYLYLVGATLKKCNVAEKISTSHAFAGILILWGLRTLLHLYDPDWTVFIFRLRRSQLTAFTDPSTLLLSVLHIIAFAGLKIPSDKLRKVIDLAAPRTFSVYLLNTHPVIWPYFVMNVFAGHRVDNLFLLVCQLVAMSCIFVIVSILIDMLRKKLFDLLQVNLLAKKAEALADACLARWLPDEE